MDVGYAVDVPSGSIKVRLLCGIPYEALLIMFCVVMVPFVTFKTLWAFVIVPPLWGFLYFNTRKDPQFLQVWAGQLSYNNLYRP